MEPANLDNQISQDENTVLQSLRDVCTGTTCDGCENALTYIRTKYGIQESRNIAERTILQAIKYQHTRLIKYLLQYTYVLRFKQDTCNSIISWTQQTRFVLCPLPTTFEASVRYLLVHLGSFDTLEEGVELLKTRLHLQNNTERIQLEKSESVRKEIDIQSGKREATPQEIKEEILPKEEQDKLILQEEINRTKRTLCDRSTQTEQETLEPKEQFTNQNSDEVYKVIVELFNNNPFALEVAASYILHMNININHFTEHINTLSNLIPRFMQESLFGFKCQPTIVLLSTIIEHLIIRHKYLFTILPYFSHYSYVIDIKDLCKFADDKNKIKEIRETIIELEKWSFIEIQTANIWDFHDQEKVHRMLISKNGMLYFKFKFQKLFKYLADLYVQHTENFMVENRMVVTKQMSLYEDKTWAAVIELEHFGILNHVVFLIKQYLKEHSDNYKNFGVRSAFSDRADFNVWYELLPSRPYMCLDKLISLQDFGVPDQMCVKMLKLFHSVPNAHELCLTYEHFYNLHSFLPKIIEFFRLKNKIAYLILCYLTCVNDFLSEIELTELLNNPEEQHKNIELLKSLFLLENNTNLEDTDEYKLKYCCIKEICRQYIHEKNYMKNICSTIIINKNILQSSKQFAAEYLGENELRKAYSTSSYPWLFCNLLASHLLTAEDLNEFSALHWAVINEDPIVVRVLLEAGADVNITTHRGITPFHLNVIHSVSLIYDYLLNAGADINKCDNAGNTPAHWFVMMFPVDDDKMNYLCEHGADFNIPNKRGETVMSILNSRSATSGNS